MKLKLPYVLLLVLLFLFQSVIPVRADGIIIPHPPCRIEPCPPLPPTLPRPMAQLDIRYHHVTVSIQDQLAVTRIDQVFYNPNDWPVEGTYVFPLPLDAAVSEFTLWIDGKPVSGEVLDAEQARAYYDEIVRSMLDPALLEYVGRGAVRASVFPIPPAGERRIELEYTQVLTAENGLVRYVYPLNTEKFSAQPLEDVSIRVEIRDRQAVRAVYSPSHPVGIDRKSDYHLTAGYEAKNVLPDSDFALYYSLGETEAFHLFSYRNPADPLDPDGFFMLLLAPKPGEAPERLAKDVLLVLDRSGSMDGEKFLQAQSALRFILKKLNPGDRFYLQAFSTGVETYARGLRPASEVNEALAWVDRLSAVGSTDINRALLEAAAAADPERPTYLIFLTDGLPTEGETNVQRILDNFARVSRPNLRLFSFGVGYDVDTVLLDTLSQENRGLSTYVRPGDSLDEILSAFYERISTPVLINLQLAFGSLATYDIYPNPLPDLFSGSQVIVVGRYRQGGTANVTLSGEIAGGSSQTLRFPEQHFAVDSRGVTGSQEMLPRLWATRKIGYLLNRIRLQGADKETIDQIVKLSVRYGIVTPYTSYLVTEPMPLGAEAQETIAGNALDQAQAMPTQSYGKAAVDRASQEGELQSADQAPQAPQGGGSSTGMQGNQIRVVGPRTFIFTEDTWMDTTFDPQRMTPQKLVFLSDEYFQLLSTRPDLAAALALGNQVTVVVDMQAYQIITEGESSGPLVLPPALTDPTVTPLSTPVEAPVVLPAEANPPDTQPAARTLPCAAALLPLAVFFGIWYAFRKVT
jgi:Ca-activated chloride channel homolog